MDTGVDHPAYSVVVGSIFRLCALDAGASFIQVIIIRKVPDVTTCFLGWGIFLLRRTFKNQLILSTENRNIQKTSPFTNAPDETCVRGRMILSFFSAMNKIPG